MATRGVGRPRRTGSRRRRQPTLRGPARRTEERPRAGHRLAAARASQERASAFLVAGISPYRAFDDSYRGFFELVAGQAAAAISNANGL